MKMKIEGYEEISLKEYKKLPRDERRELIDGYDETICYFKKTQKFPICFEDDSYKIEVIESNIKIIHKLNEKKFDFNYDKSFPLLVKAVEKAKEVIKNEKRK